MDLVLLLNLITIMVFHTVLVRHDAPPLFLLLSLVHLLLILPPPSLILASFILLVRPKTRPRMTQHILTAAEL
eukprot:9038158-Pyramimonas_sp.AAC.1